MTKSDKIRAQIAAGSVNLRFAQVDSYLTGIGATSRQVGSHVMYHLPNGAPIGLAKPHGGRTTIKPVYIKALHAELTKFEIEIADDAEEEK